MFIQKQYIMEQCIKLFVPLGTQKFPFNRLIKALNGLVERGLYKPEEIVMQSSIYEVEPNFSHYELIPAAQFDELIDKAQLVITHSGVNSIISCMKRKKPLIIVPRLKKYGEHVDNHQVEIAELMKQKFDVVVIEDLSKLEEAIEEARHHEYKPWVSHNAELVSAIKDLVDKI